MQPEQFTKIGNQVADFSGLFIGVAVAGLLCSLKRKHRWGGLMAVMGFVAELWLQLPYPYCVAASTVLVVAGNILDLVLSKELSPIKARSSILGNVVLGVTYVSGAFIFDIKKDITLGADHFISRASVHKPFTANRLDVRGSDFAGSDGKAYEWRFQGPLQGTKGRFLANVLDSEVYWDHAGLWLTGEQVADRVAAWAGVQFHRESYDEVMPAAMRQGRKR